MEQITPTLSVSPPVLPIRNNVIFPSTSIPLVVGRKQSLAAVDQAEATDSLVLVLAQNTVTEQDPEPEHLYRVGTLFKSEGSSPCKAGSRQVVVTGIARFQVNQFERESQGYLIARGEIVADIHGFDPVKGEALFFNLKELSREILELLPGSTEPLVRLMDRIDDAGYLTHICAAYLNLTLSQKQELLETVDIQRRMDLLLAYMRKEREVLNLQHEIRGKMSERLNKAQRDALLREQIKTIRTELGDEATEENTDEIEQKLLQANLPVEALKQANEELRRLKNLPSNSAEYHVIRTYLEWMAALPWSAKTQTEIDIKKAREILDEDHYGLQSVKKRILQFLAVAKLKNDIRGPILCLVGPPGVGKTSLGASMARAMGRKFIRTSLGGIRDEAEIRGHRRTYVGAMPGRIVQSLKRIGSRNPILMLDEIDKLGADFHGDPSAAMLEVLDPEQNCAFTDHYIDTPFDLSDVFFIATANVLDTIPSALRDRMEIIEVNGYTSREKLFIANQHLLPKQLAEHGLKSEWVNIPDDVIDYIITHHTREAGVRELQRQIASLLRSVAEKIVENVPNSSAPGSNDSPRENKAITITKELAKEWLGSEKFYPEFAERSMKPGVALGLAWTPHGGDLLYIEAAAIEHGGGKLTLTGQLGDVMKESAQIALSLVKSANSPMIPKDYPFNERDIHIHVPAGSIPKDGPSAGVTLFSSLVSLVSGKAIPSDLSMTGEITLRGAVLPIGGVKEKVLAAHRAGLKRILLPKRNEADLKDVPQEVLSQLQFHFVETIDDLLSQVLSPPVSLAA
jgi:ATP-dependent Lon protease